MPDVNESAWSKMFREIAKFFNLDRQTPKKTKPTARFKSAVAGGELKDDVIDFGDFAAVRLPSERPSSLAKKQDLTNFALDIARRVRGALVSIGLERYTLVELYMPGDTESDITRIFEDEPDGIRQFERICETEIFGLGGINAGPGDAARVYVVPRKLAFHKVFDPILNDRLIVRPIGTTKAAVPLDPTEADFKSDQLLIGLFQIFEVDRTPVDRAPIWAWRSKREQNSIRIDVDFDIMTRAFTNPERQLFPLGLNVRCKFRQLGGARIIDSVTIDISGAKRWIDYLTKIHREEEVSYHIDVGGGRGYEKYTLQDHTLNSIDVRLENTGTDFHLGTDDQGNERKIPINRLFSVFIKTRDKSYAYRMGFFEKALNYVPAKNIMKVTGQLIPADEPVDVMLPPGESRTQEPIFSLTPVAPDEGRFKLYLLETAELDLIRNQQQRITPGTEIEVEIGDEIQATSPEGAGGRREEYEFKILDLGLIPNEVCEREGRRYAAIVKTEPPQERRFVLYEKEIIFGSGSGRHFSEEAVGILPNALKFRRPWVFLTMSASKNQEVFYFNKTAKAKGVGKRTAKRLGEQEVELELNASYEVYLGDFQITLDLRATPSSSSV
jgi:hypothetical protein